MKLREILQKLEKLQFIDIRFEAIDDTPSMLISSIEYLACLHSEHSHVIKIKKDFIKAQDLLDECQIGYMDFSEMLVGDAMTIYGDKVFCVQLPQFNKSSSRE